MLAIDMNAFLEKQKNLFSKLDKIRSFYLKLASFLDEVQVSQTNQRLNLV